MTMLIDRIDAEIAALRRAKDPCLVKLVTLRAAALAQAKERRAATPTDGEVIKAVRTFLSGLIQLENDCTARQLPVPATVEVERRLYGQFLPLQLDEARLTEIIASYLAEAKLEKHPKAIGTVMNELARGYDGLYDGKQAAALVRAALGLG